MCSWLDWMVAIIHPAPLREKTVFSLHWWKPYLVYFSLLLFSSLLLPLLKNQVFLSFEFGEWNHATNQSAFTSEISSFWTQPHTNLSDCACRATTAFWKRLYGPKETTLFCPLAFYVKQVPRWNDDKILSCFLALKNHSTMLMLEAQPKYVWGFFICFVGFFFKVSYSTIHHLVEDAPCRGSWTRWPLMVPSKPQHSVILWFHAQILVSRFKEQHCSLACRSKDSGKGKSYGHFVVFTPYMNASITGFSYLGQQRLKLILVQHQTLASRRCFENYRCLPCFIYALHNWITPTVTNPCPALPLHRCIRASSKGIK